MAGVPNEGVFPMRMSKAAAMAAVAVLALTACNQTTKSGQDTATTTAETTTSSAAAGIDGTWKADVTSAKFDQKPDEFLLQNAKYDCKTCTPPLSVPADGAFHAVTGHPYYDQISLKTVDDKTVQQATRFKGRDVGSSTMKVSADGNTLGIDWKDMTVANAPPSTGHSEETRVAAAPAGAHAISGSWKPSKVENINAEALTVSFRTEGETLHMSSPSGTSYDAKLDGSDTPIKGDPAGTTASVKKLANGSIEETDKRAGKVVWVGTFMPGSDGKLHVDTENKLDGSKVSYTADKS
jgi:hypothetical protein